MTVEYIRYKISDEQRKLFIQAIESACKILIAYPDCLGYQLSHCEEDKANFIWRIEWTSVDRHLNGFRKSDQFMQFFTLVKPFFSNIQEMNHYETLIQS